MAGQQDSCWRCGAAWSFEVAPRTTLRAIAVERLVPPVAERVRAAARVDDDRWVNEGGSVASERAGPLPAVAATG
jgi:hypothetical protein